ncbi:transposase, truncation [Ruegeria pomeroyi DSS-3]|uniref:Transposase, truncation n=1 Tax=Ruegeria pomeroyi (strain ATCC 700808 / DSM 15171 / DSS-3) TaxID=246200 RepID=Q5LSW2_RUEPO|nr:transposase, truncation [Ruegeria pomeroyi DSS-3]
MAVARATQERRRRCHQVARFLVEDVPGFRAAQRWGLVPAVGGRETRRLQMLYRILLGTCYLPGDLRQQIDAFDDHHNHRRCHESPQNLAPANVYFGHGQTILKKRERVKRMALETRRLLHRKSPARSKQPDGSAPLRASAAICPKTPDDGQSGTQIRHRRHFLASTERAPHPVQEKDKARSGCACVDGPK